MDGALKLKEISYIHAEGYPTGETKHGPNALIDENLPVVIIATCDRNDPGSILRYEKNVANIHGFRQQKARVIAIATEGDAAIEELADYTHLCPRSAGVTFAHPRNRPPAIVRVSHGGAERARRGPAAEPGEVRDSRVKVSMSRPGATRQLIISGRFSPFKVQSRFLSSLTGNCRLRWSILISLQRRFRSILEEQASTCERDPDPETRNLSGFVSLGFVHCSSQPHYRPLATKS